MVVEFDNKKIKINKKYNNLDNYYTFNAISNKNEIMATLTFKVGKTGNKIWLYKINTDEKFSHKGVGSALIYALEDFAFKNKVNYIEGKFFPENKYAKPFYEKLGYEIYKDGYETFVGKDLDNKNINFLIIDDNEYDLTF